MRLCNQWGNLLIIYALGSWYWYRKHKPKVFGKSNHKRQKLAIVCCIKRPRIQNHDLALQVLHRCFSCWSLEEIETMRSANYPPKKNIHTTMNCGTCCKDSFGWEVGIDIALWEFIALVSLLRLLQRVPNWKAHRTFWHRCTGSMWYIY